MEITYNYLALGDSYTCGEGVPYFQSFPYQTTQLLRKQKHKINAPEIIAVTGYTTFELLNLIENSCLLPNYNLISLLIGVNNQYRGLSLTDFALSFQQLIKLALKLANNKTTHVAVISIPDWSKTPFAKDKPVEIISKEIDEFNAVAKQITLQYQIAFLDITESYRIDAGEANFLTADLLHPSAAEYAKWATQLAAYWNKILNGD